MGKLFKDGINAINSTLIQTITDLQNLRPVIEDMRQELTHTFGMTDTASGSVASFSDGAGGVAVKDLKVNIVPSQDLHGQTSPFPAGGGTNLYTGTYTPATKMYLLASSPYNVTYSAGLASERSIIMPCSSNTKYIVRSGMQGTLRAASFTSTPVDGSAPTVFETASSSTDPTSLTITTGASDGYMFIQFFINGDDTNYGCTLEGCLTGFYYAVYENICPITGWDSVKIANDPRQASFVNWNQKVINGNFADGTEHWSATSSRVLMTAEHNAIKGDILTTSAHTAKNIRQEITTYNGHKYYAGFDGKFTASSDTHYLLISLSTNSNNTSDRVIKQVTVGAWNRIEGIITASQDCSYLTVGTNDITASGDYFEIKNVNLIDLTAIYGAGNEPTLEAFRLVYPNTYYPYDVGSVSTQYAINTDPDACITKELGQTVYGGTLDLTTGVLTVTHIKATILSVTQMSGAYGMYKLGDYGSIVGGVGICNMLKKWDGTASQMPVGYFNCINSSGYNRAQAIFRFDGVNVTKADYEQYLADLNTAGTPLEIVYEPATPVTYQLTPEQLYQFTLDNNIFANCGAVEVTYRLNLATAISRLQGA